jgi:hypothetical protein
MPRYRIAYPPEFRRQMALLYSVQGWLEPMGSPAAAASTALGGV